MAGGLTSSSSSSSSYESSPLYEKISLKNNRKRAIEFFILVLLISLVLYRLFTLDGHGFVWTVAMACESWFTFIWLLTFSIKWNPVAYKTYPQRLLQRVREVPPIDMFVTTSDPGLEPPVLTVNTVLSLLAVDYPANKLACYVSDDGCSPLTYYSLKEAFKFAKLWVPFCKKYDIPTRAPFRYFSPDYRHDNDSKVKSPSTEFERAYHIMKEEYEKMCKNIEVAGQKTIPCDLTGDFAEFSNIEGRDHPTIIKIIWENKDGDDPDGVPHLVYISREKRPKYPHHYKAGAMNVLTRVSGLLTNAPYMLNVDCDMFANNPRVAVHALCLLLGTKTEAESAYVQFPQKFYDGLEDDPFGNQMVVLYEFMGRGIVGIQGSFYQGTGCFHRRKVIYGAWPNDIPNRTNLKPNEKDTAAEDSLKGFGSSKEFVLSASYALEGRNMEPNSLKDLSRSLEAAHKISSCAYEHNTDWGSKIGWMYGSTTEDILTGLNIHRKGWRSTYSTPDPPAFLGCAPNGGPAAMTQMKRWATGLLEILASRKSPIYATLFGRLQYRMCLAYLWLLLWAVRSIPEIIYALLPAYCIITNSHFLPKVSDPVVAIPTLLFLSYNIFTLFEYFQVGLSVRAWWNNQRMQRVTSACAWSFGFLGVVLKLLGISQTVFEVTKKETSAPGDGETVPAGKFTFDNSPVFIPGTTLVLVELTALVMMVLGLRLQAHGSGGTGIGEVICAMWVVICFGMFVRGLFEKKGGIPLPTVIKSAAMATLFVHFSIFTSRA